MNGIIQFKKKKISSKELTKLKRKYKRLFKRYNDLYDKYELCEEGWDSDILSWLEPELEQVLEEIFELEQELERYGEITLPESRRYLN